MIKFSCPHCGKKLQVSEENAGRTGSCQVCGKQVTAPQASQEPGTNESWYELTALTSDPPAAKLFRRSTATKTARDRSAIPGGDKRALLWGFVSAVTGLIVGVTIGYFVGDYAGARWGAKQAEQQLEKARADLTKANQDLVKAQNDWEKAEKNRVDAERVAQLSKLEATSRKGALGTAGGSSSGEPAESEMELKPDSKDPKKGRIVFVSGYVEGIEKDPDDKHYLGLRQMEAGVATLHCYFDPKLLKQFEKLKKDDMVKIRGVYQGKAEQIITILTNCQIAK